MDSPACLIETILFSCDFRSVDEPLHSAVDLFYALHGNDAVMPSFVRPAFDAAKASQLLNPKRALWLVLMLMLPPIAEYASSHARRRDRAAALGAWLEVEVERLFAGAYHAHERPLDAFVVAAQITYNSST